MFELKEFYHKSIAMIQNFLREGIFFAINPQVRETLIKYIVPYCALSNISVRYDSSPSL